MPNQLGFNFPYANIQIKPLFPLPDFNQTLAGLVRSQAALLRGAGGGHGGGGGRAGAAPQEGNPRYGRYVDVPQGDGTTKPVWVWGTGGKERDKNAEAAVRNAQLAILAKNEKLQESLKKLPTLSAQGQKEELEKIRKDIMPGELQKTGMTAEDFSKIILEKPLAEQRAREKLVNEGYIGKSLWDGARMAFGSLYDAISSIGKTSEEKNAIGHARAEENAKIRAENPYLDEQQRLAAEGRSGLGLAWDNRGTAAASALAGMAPVLGPGLLGMAIGGPVGLATGIAGGALGGGAMAAGEALERVAEDPNLTQEQKLKVIDDAQTRSGLVAGAIGALPMGPIGAVRGAAAKGLISAARVNPIGPGKVRSAVEHAVDNALLGAGFQMGSNAAYGSATGQDIPLMQGVGESALAGAVLGIPFGIRAGVHNNRLRAADNAANKAARANPVAEADLQEGNWTPRDVAMPEEVIGAQAFARDETGRRYLTGWAGERYNNALADPNAPALLGDLHPPMLLTDNLLIPNRIGTTPEVQQRALSSINDTIYPPTIRPSRVYEGGPIPQPAVRQQFMLPAEQRANPPKQIVAGAAHPDVTVIDDAVASGNPAAYFKQYINALPLTNRFERAKNIIKDALVARKLSVEEATAMRDAISNKNFSHRKGIQAGIEEARKTKATLMEKRDVNQGTTATGSGNEQLASVGTDGRLRAAGTNATNISANRPVSADTPTIAKPVADSNVAEITPSNPTVERRGNVGATPQDTGTLETSARTAGRPGVGGTQEPNGERSVGATATERTESGTGQRSATVEASAGEGNNRDAATTGSREPVTPAEKETVDIINAGTQPMSPPDNTPVKRTVKIGKKEITVVPQESVNAQIDDLMPKIFGTDPESKKIFDKYFAVYERNGGDIDAWTPGELNRVFKNASIDRQYGKKIPAEEQKIYNWFKKQGVDDIEIDKEAVKAAVAKLKEQGINISEPDFLKLPPEEAQKLMTDYPQATVC